MNLKSYTHPVKDFTSLGKDLQYSNNLLPKGNALSKDRCPDYKKQDPSGSADSSSCT